MKNMTKGKVFDIQHFSFDDGPGIRTIVFLKGCQMHCLWCHNPESLDGQRSEMAFVPSKCVGCGYCFKVCPNGCHYMENGKHIIDREKCTFCGKCTRLCAGNALSICADKNWSVEEVLAEVEKDRSYYEESGGGMTISGGEPMMHPQFVAELAAEAKRRGISVAMETNGCYDFSLLDGIWENIDVFLIDWKESDDEKHIAYTGCSHKKVYENIQKLHDLGKKIILRCPIIPGYNDEKSHFKKIAELTQEFPNLIGAELMPYHSMGVSKIERFGLEERVKYIVSEPPEKETQKKWLEICRSYGGRMLNEID